MIETVLVTEVVTTTVVGPGMTSTVTRTEVTTIPPATLPGETVTVTGTATTTTLSVCPSLTINPTYTPPTPLPTDYTWGCRPGYLCRPRHLDVVGGCNFEAGLPAVSYICSPDECIESPPYIEDQYWGEPIVSDEVSTYNLSMYYFNLNPEIFGLNYSIFRFPESDRTRNIHYKKSYSEDAEWNRLLARQGQDLVTDETIPGVCYDECNAAGLEAQLVGKTKSLCNGPSPFMDMLADCRSCCDRWGEDDNLTFDEGLMPDFQQFLGFCQDQDDGGSTAEPITTRRTKTAAISTRVSTTENSATRPTADDGEDDNEPTESSTTITATSTLHSTATSTSSPAPNDDDSTTTAALTGTETETETASSNDEAEISTGSGTSSPTSSSGGNDTTEPTGTSTASLGTDSESGSDDPPSAMPSPPQFTGAATSLPAPFHYGIILVLLGFIL
ncbi:hypothetical protein BJX63DRAFT_393422 [Aspergillus granulosus]|uniref:Uncharacterized protein n=1 Tax=Aspergillus granulosus TaxID=176169 RepID=A0ABR4HED7_9EURO